VNLEGICSVLRPCVEQKSVEGVLHKRWWARVTVVSGLAFVVLTIPIAMRRNWPGDMDLVEWALALRLPGWTAVMQAVTFLGTFAVGSGLCAGLSVALWVRFRRLDRQVWLPLAAIVGSVPVNAGLRIVVARLRPDVTYIPDQLPALTHPFQRWSYPSGHAMTATICYGLLLYLLVYARPRLARWMGPGYALWVGIIGFSRVYLGVHWPSDVLAGYLVGGFWLSICMLVLGDRPIQT
jgi:membrane-associated phospholipid phosphatase